MRDVERPNAFYTVRELSGMRELNTVADLEQRIWGTDTVTMQPELLLAMQDEGALLAGAFTQEGELVAFVFGFPTRDPKVQHSHALGILEGHRNAGLGARLKWWQRAWCLAHGIHTVRWTYDPLRVQNAKLNIHKLGAVAHEYLPDYYGQLTGINAGTPSDRLMAVWTLEDLRVLDRLEGRFQTEPRDALVFELPADFGALQMTDPSAALEWRLRGRAFLQAAFAKGYQITGLQLEPVCAYLLELR